MVKTPVDILSILPHRHPFLLIDRVLECEPGKTLIAEKNVTANEPYFQGHFPGRPIMPGVLIIETMAQASAVMFHGHNLVGDGLQLLVGVDKARFRRQVVPGDRLVVKINFEQSKRNLCMCSGEAFVDESLVASAQLKMIADTRD